MATHIGFSPIQQFLTGFADDLVIHRDVRSWSDLYAAHDMVRLLLHYLQEAGLEVNYGKCNIMVKLAGRQSKQAKRIFKSQEVQSGRKVTVWNIDASQQSRRPMLFSHSSSLPTFSPLPSFELVDSFKYLGVMVSYSNPEDLTFALRQERAEKKKQKVRQFIHNKRKSKSASRLLVWRATVWSTATFGLESVGLSGRKARALRSWHARQVRAVTHNPVHKTRETTVALCTLLTRLKLAPPLQQLHDRSAQRLESLRKRLSTVPACEVTSCFTTATCDPYSDAQPGAWPNEDILTTPSTIKAAEEIVASYSRIITEAEEDPSPDVPMYTCCGKVFRSAAGLRTHRTVKHQTPALPPVEFSRFKHGLGGLPQCSKCHVKFKNWHNLQQHVERRVCRQEGIQLAKPASAARDDEAPAKASEVTSSHQELAMPGQQATERTSAQMTLQLDSAPVISRMRSELQQQAGDQTFLALITGELGSQLTNTCLLCDSWIASTTKIAFHLTKKHKTEWEAYKESKWNNNSKMYVLTRLSSCPACGVKVESVPRHTQQCPVIQQLQLFFFLHPQSPLSKSHSSLPQSQISRIQQTQATMARPQAMAPNHISGSTDSTTQLESLTQVTLQPTASQPQTIKSAEKTAMQSKQSLLHRWFQKERPHQKLLLEKSQNPLCHNVLIPRLPRLLPQSRARLYS